MDEQEKNRMFQEFLKVFKVFRGDDLGNIAKQCVRICGDLEDEEEEEVFFVALIHYFRKEAEQVVMDKASEVVLRGAKLTGRAG